MSMMHSPNKDFYVVYKGGCIWNNVYLQQDGIKIGPNNAFGIIKIIEYENGKSLNISLWPEL